VSAIVVFTTCGCYASVPFAAMKKDDAIQEFRACVLDAYRPLLEHAAFREMPKRSVDYVNDYSVRIGNSTTVIEIEGIHYGKAAWLKLFRATEADADHYGLPIGQLLALRISRRKVKGSKLEGQLAQIRQDAEDILQYAQDVLAGDFSALDDLVKVQNQLDEERRARMPSPAQRAADAACAAAGHAFKQGDHRKVVELLTPHLDLLSPLQMKRFETSKVLITDA